MNLHDWIDELCDVLDVEAEVDEGLLADLTKVAAHNVEHMAAPVTAYLLGFAAATHCRRTPSRWNAWPRRRRRWPRAGTARRPHRTPTTSTTRSPTTALVDHTGDLYEV